MISSYLDMNWSCTSCYLFEMFTETLPQMLHNASIYITLVLAVQRYIYVCHATRYLDTHHFKYYNLPSTYERARHLVTIPRAQKTVIFIGAMSVVFMVPRLFDRIYNVEEDVCFVQNASWLKDENLYFSIIFW